MISILTAALCVLAITIGWKAWSHRLNPITTGALVWSPAIILATMPREFISPIYSHLNHEIGISVFVALILGFFSFSIGVYLSFLVIGRRSWTEKTNTQFKINVHEGRLLILFFLGFSIYLYTIQNAGLVGYLNYSYEEISERRIALHSSLSFLVFFLDIAAIIFFARMLETGRYLYCMPMLISIVCHMSTLQKSPLLFLVISIVYLCLIYSRQALVMLIGTARKKLVIALSIITLVFSLFIMNSIRGIGVTPMTTFEWSWYEQIYIYSGATAILNLSATIEGLIPTHHVAYNLFLFRPITWHLLGWKLMDIGQYFHGINTGTYLIYPWVDFQWIGFFITPFLTGAIVVAFHRLAFKKTVYGIMLGAIAFKATIFSPLTDVIFDPTTSIMIFFALIAHIFVVKRVRKPRCCKVDA